MSIQTQVAKAQAKHDAHMIRQVKVNAKLAKQQAVRDAKFLKLAATSDDPEIQATAARMRAGE